MTIIMKNTFSDDDNDDDADDDEDKNDDDEKISNALLIISAGDGQYGSLGRPDGHVPRRQGRGLRRRVRFVVSYPGKIT